MAEHRPFTGLGRLAAIVVTLGFVLVLTAYGVLTGMSYSVSDRADQGWARRIGSMEDLLDRYPSRDCNAAAIELERVVARLGIDLSPRNNMREVDVADVDADAWHEAGRKLGKYLDKELERTVGFARPPEPEVTEWLDAYAEPIDAVVAQLIHGDPPRWTLRLENLHATHLPNLMAHLHLQRILAVDALYRAQRGETESALARVEAGWRLQESLAGDPVMVTQLVAQTEMRTLVGVLRRIAPVPVEWRRRLAAAQPRQALLEALEFEAWMWSHVDEMGFTAPLNGVSRVAYQVAAPYVRMCAADGSNRMRLKIERLRQVDYLCDRDLSIHGADLAIDYPFWNRLAGTMVPNLSGTVERVARLEVDIELTQRVLELRAQHTDGDGPAAGAYFEPSIACPDDYWNYRFAPDEGVTIELSRQPDWAKSVGYDLPLRFESGR